MMMVPPLLWVSRALKLSLCPIGGVLLIHTLLLPLPHPTTAPPTSCYYPTHILLLPHPLTIFFPRVVQEATQLDDVIRVVQEATQLDDVIRVVQEATQLDDVIRVVQQATQLDDVIIITRRRLSSGHKTQKATYRAISSPA